MELSSRLQAVADMVTEGRKVADIGCDHGYVSIYLCRQKKCPKVIAMDVKKGPLERARTNIARYGLSQYIEVRLSDGANALQKGEADTLLLAGMGGRLVIRIVGQAFERLGEFEELILQPQSELFLVRAFLRQNEMEIVDETMVLDDGKYYTVIKAQPEADCTKGIEGRKEKEYRPIVEDYFGPVLLQKRPQVFEKFLEKELEKTEMLLAQIKNPQRTAELQEYLSYVKEALKK
jgi:tRNA (adenine22-N1)-methyltransferase